MNKLDGWISIEQDVVRFVLLNDDPSTAKLLKLKLGQILHGTAAKEVEISLDYIW